MHKTKTATREEYQYMVDRMLEAKRYFGVSDEEIKRYRAYYTGWMDKKFGKVERSKLPANAVIDWHAEVPTAKTAPPRVSVFPEEMFDEYGNFIPPQEKKANA